MIFVKTSGFGRYANSGMLRSPNGALPDSTASG